MKLWCPNGCASSSPFKTEGFQRQSHESNCPDCEGRLLTGMELNARKRLSRAGARLREESPAEREARAAFNAAVLAWPCFARENRPGHRCAGRKDAHHLIPKDWIRQTFRDLPEPALLAILFEPLIGCPACRAFHIALEQRTDFIHWDELEPEAIEFCQRIDAKYPGHPSMLARLEIESPKRKAAA